MPSNRPNPRMMPGGPLAIIALAVLLIAATAPAVSASVLIDESIEEYDDKSAKLTVSPVGGGSSSDTSYNRIYVENIEKVRYLNYIGFDTPGSASSSISEGSHSFTWSLGQTNPTTGTGVFYVTHSRNILGQVIATRTVLFFHDWDIGTFTGRQLITINKTFCQYGQKSYIAGSSSVSYTGGDNLIRFTLQAYPISSTPQYISIPVNPYTVTISAYDEWNNHLTVTETDEYYGRDIDINLQRIVNGRAYTSTIDIIKDDATVFTQTAPSDISLFYPLNQVSAIKITTLGGTVYSFPLVEVGEPTEEQSTVSVYIQNSQTGALIADAHLSILAASGDPPELFEVVNRTLPGGVGTYILQPTGPTNPNPRYYRAVATVPGYTQIIENHSFTLNGPHDVIIEMRPDTGGPLDPDRAYLEFYVRDIHANPISSASVQCDGRIKTTNSQGYAVFEVSKNATYPYVAKKSGYVTIEGTATVADGPRYVANVVLGPGTVPTYTPTIGPGETPGGPGATPTPDARTNEQKGQAIIDLIADFAEPIAILAILATIFGLMKMMTPGRR